MPLQDSTHRGPVDAELGTQFVDCLAVLVLLDEPVNLVLAELPYLPTNGLRGHTALDKHFR
ncbi:MAG: hypothetical protein LBG99_06675 [Propionibacteriaceae bacterium]|nr:hypothetical protein [Propionibacteriaceae bacterium]